MNDLNFIRVESVFEFAQCFVKRKEGHQLRPLIDRAGVVSNEDIE